MEDGEDGLVGRSLWKKKDYNVKYQLSAIIVYNIITRYMESELKLY